MYSLINPSFLIAQFSKNEAKNVFVNKSVQYFLSVVGTSEDSVNSDVYSCNLGNEETASRKADIIR